MSVILAWENPPDIYSGLCSRVRILCKDANGLRPDRVVTQDACWGFHEDTETNSTLGLYLVEYVSDTSVPTPAPGGPPIPGNLRTGAVIPGLPSNCSTPRVTLQNHEVRRWVRPADSCRVDIHLTRPTGEPDVARVIEFSDEYHAAGTQSYRILTNRAGRAVFYSRSDTQWLIRVAGELKASFVVIPKARSIELEDLRYNFGIPVDTDPRQHLDERWS